MRFQKCAAAPQGEFSKEILLDVAIEEVDHNRNTTVELLVKKLAHRFSHRGKAGKNVASDLTQIPIPKAKDRVESSSVQPELVIVVPTWLERWVITSAIHGAKRQRNSEVPLWKRGGTLIIHSNMGPRSAARVAAWLETLELRRLWLVGVCGGLTEGLNTGDVVLSDATIVAGGDRWNHRPEDELVTLVRTQMARLDCRTIVGPIYSADRPLGTLAQKRAAAESGAVAVEMEAGPLAQWAAREGRQFIHLRVVLDPHDRFPLMWRRPAGFAWEVLGFPFLRQMWTAERSLRWIVGGLSQPGAPLEGPRDREAEELRLL